MNFYFLFRSSQIIFLSLYSYFLSTKGRVLFSFLYLYMSESNSTWFNSVKQNIETISADNIKPKDVRFYNLGGFLHIAERVDEFSTNCTECVNCKPEIMEVSENIDKYINTSSKTRKEFEQKREKFSLHLKKGHGLVKKNTYAATYAFIGLIIGALGGYLFAKIFILFAEQANPNFLKVSLLVGWALGIVGGRILGTLKDKKIVKAKLFY